MSQLTYAGVVLPYPFNTSFVQEPVFDEMSNTDWCLTKYEISLQCVISSSYLIMMASNLVGTTNNPAEIMASLRTQLNKPRRALSFSFNGKELLPRLIGPGTVDAKNGPQVKACNYVNMTNNTFLLNFAITAYYWENRGQSNTSVVPLVGAAARAGNNVIWNRWSEWVDIDNANYSTLTREGKYIIRSDNMDGVEADDVRSNMAVVGVIDGFLRRSSYYKQSPDGLGIEYRVVDEEVFKLPPNPAFEAKGQYVESTTKLGAMRWGAAKVWLKGDKATRQEDLVKLAIAVVARKLIINGAALDVVTRGFALLEQCVFTVDMYKNEVECYMKCMMKPNTQDATNRFEGVAGVNLTQLVNTPGSSTATKPLYLNRGTAGYVLQAAAYYDPSLQGTALNPVTGQMTAGLPVGEAGTKREP